MTSPIGKRCFLCDETSEDIVWKERGLEGRRCSCGMVYAAGEPSAFPEDLAHEFHAEEFYAEPARLKAQWIAANAPPGRLLEVGAGNPHFLREAMRLGYQVVGLEPDEQRAKQVAGALGVPVLAEWIEANSLPKNSFDVVYHCDLLVHFPDPLLALTKMVELLTPGGVLAFEVGILGGISPRWYSLIGELGLGQHLWFYSDRALRELMRRVPLRLLHEQHFGLAPQVLIHRPVEVIFRRVVAPSLRMTGLAQNLAEASEQAERARRRFANFMRYRIGRFAPHLGPSTRLMVLAPVVDARGK